MKLFKFLLIAAAIGYLVPATIAWWMHEDPTVEKREYISHIITEDYMGREMILYSERK